MVGPPAGGLFLCVAHVYQIQVVSPECAVTVGALVQEGCPLRGGIWGKSRCAFFPDACKTRGFRGKSIGRLIFCFTKKPVRL